jgi:hypothetical protein
MNKKSRNYLLPAVALATFLSWASFPASAQFGSGGSSTGTPVRVNTPPVVPVRPQPEMPPPVRTFIPPIRNNNTIQPIQPIDVTPLGISGLPEVESADALDGIRTLNSFPTEGDGSMDQVLVRGTEESKFKKTNSYSVRFDEGEILVSVRKPTRVAFVTFDCGTVALNPDADVMLKRVNDVYHIINFDGRGETVKIKFSGGDARSQDAKVVALAPGFEVVVGDRVLKHSDIRLADGCARRHFKSLDDGKVVVCEISTESVMRSSSVIAHLHQSQSEEMDRRIIGDMSKMAAVLNYVNGTQGFQTASK